jgi:hypothetical protein
METSHEVRVLRNVAASVASPTKLPRAPYTSRPFGASRYWVSGHPALVREWDADFNGTLTPDSGPAGSGRKIWWTCPRGPDHRWRASPNNRTSGGTGCPFCANRRVSLTNCLATCFPRVAAEWHPAGNGIATPYEVVASTARIVWWRCATDPTHAWRASVRDRTRRQTLCPFCAHRMASPGSSLAKAHAVLSGEWHRTRNGPLSPESVQPGSDRRVWWQCSVEPTHVWRATVANRVLRASGCPDCARCRRRPNTSTDEE